MNWTLLTNSLLVSSLTTVLALGLGLLAALLLIGLERRGRTVLLAGSILALALPPFLVTNTWLDLLGPTGLWRGFVPLNIVSLGGAVWILSLLTWPITLLAVGGVWQRLEASQLESDPALRGSALIRGLLLPLARPALGQAAALTFILALNDFAVPAILQIKVFPAEVWVRFSTNFDTWGALWLSWPLILTPLLLLYFLGRHPIAWPHKTGGAPARLLRQQLGAVCKWSCAAVTALLCSLSIGVPVYQLVSAKRTWTELPGAVAAGQAALWNSFWFAALSAALVIALGLLVVTLRVTSRRPFLRFNAFNAFNLFNASLSLPFLVPGVLLGVVLIALFNRPYLALLYQSAAIVILAFVLRYLGWGWTGITRAAAMADTNLVEVARLEGANRWQTLRHALWPQVSSQVAGVWYIVFLLCLWDVESMILVYPPGGETVALRIFNLLHYGHNAQVNALCLALLALAVAPLILWQGRCLTGTARLVWRSRVEPPPGKHQAPNTRLQ